MDDDNLINYNLVICAVVFGADDSILKVQLGDAFSFQRKSLMPMKDHLDTIFETDELGLRREYGQARIDESLDVICVFKKIQIKLAQKEAKKYYDNMCDYILKYLDDKIRAIRLFVEAPVRFKKLSIGMQRETQWLGKTKMDWSFSSLIPIGEAMATQTIQKFSCTDEKIRILNADILQINFPLADKLLNSCHIYYDLSYHQKNFVSVALLITCLEILFINKENGKQKKLSKRCAVFLFDTKPERIDCYRKLFSCYKKRSDFVHDGDYSEISNKDILFLRECVRRALIKYISTGVDKKSLIKSLESDLLEIDYLTQS